MNFDPRSIDAALRRGDDEQLARIEDATINAAQPPEQLLLDGWLLRFSPGKARRSRSVNAVAAGCISLEDKLSRCRAWYERERLPLLFRVTPFSRPTNLDEFLGAHGFDAFDDTRVMVRTLGAADAAPASPSSSTRIETIDIDAFAAHVGAMRGSPAAQVRAHAQRLRALAPQIGAVRLLMLVDDAPVAAGQILIEADHAGLYDIVTSGPARGRGYGRLLSRALLAAAASCGARAAYLQVDSANHPARRIYAALGFVDRYAYWYRWPAGTTDQISSPALLQEQLP